MSRADDLQAAHEWTGSRKKGELATNLQVNAIPDLLAVVQAMKEIERMAGAAGAGEIPARAIANYARRTLAAFEES